MINKETEILLLAEVVKEDIQEAKEEEVAATQDLIDREVEVKKSKHLKASKVVDGVRILVRMILGEEIVSQ